MNHYHRRSYPGAVWRRALLIVVLAQVALLCRPAGGWAEPNGSAPAGFLLPWACGQGYRVTWGPEEHWAAAKATGLAYDFALPVGVPLYAPTGGTAYYLEDTRAVDVNLGHYVEIVDRSGNWLVRLAHLRDAQSGAIPVAAGDLIGYSGSSGAPAAHLHLELMMRDGGRWVAPDPPSLGELYGLPLSAYVEGAIIANPDCHDRLSLDGAVTADAAALALGRAVPLSVPLHNPGSEPVGLHMVQVALVHADGTAQVAEAEGQWTLAPRETLAVTVTAWPGQEGEWQASAVVYETDAATPRLAASGGFSVAPSALRLIGVSLRQDEPLAVGARPRFEVWVENVGPDELPIDDLILQGRRPDGGAWRTALGRGRVLGPGSVTVLRLGADLPVQQVGEWQVTEVSYRRDARDFAFAHPHDAFMVDGPQLAAEELEVTPGDEGLNVRLRLRNVGNAAAEPQEIELWGWQPGDQEPFTVWQTLDEALAPGVAADLQFQVPTASAGTWRVVSAGYWRDGDHYTLPLPQQPAIPVGRAEAGS